MSELIKLPNVGKVLEGLLIEAGITTSKELREIGAVEAFIKIRKKNPTACIRMLYGIEGAVEGVKDKYLSDNTKNELKRFYNSL